jgi:hypothetical protein
LVALELEHIGKSGVLEKGIEVLEKLEEEYSRLKIFARDR